MDEKCSPLAAYIMDEEDVLEVPFWLHFSPIYLLLILTWRDFKEVGFSLL